MRFVVLSCYLPRRTEIIYEKFRLDCRSPQKRFEPCSYRIKVRVLALNQSAQLLPRSYASRVKQHVKMIMNL
jgi:hypothetical protein